MMLIMNGRWSSTQGDASCLTDGSCLITSRGKIVHRDDLERMSQDWRFERRHGDVAHRALAGDQQAIDRFYDAFSSGQDFAIGMFAVIGILIAGSVVGNALKRRRGA